MNHKDIQRVSDLLCACYRWLGERDNLTSQDVQFLVTQRGSIETIKRESKNETYYVVGRDTEIAGMVSVKNNEITKLYVHPEWHRRGFGKLLFDKAEEIIAENGYTKLILSAIAESPLLFYNSMGMTISGLKTCKMGQETGREVILLEKVIDKKPNHRNQTHKNATS